MSATESGKAGSEQEHIAPKVGIIGLGYVGLPLAVTFANARIPVLGLDAVSARVDEINGGRSYIEDVAENELRPLVESGLIRATTSWDSMRWLDALIMCVPTPLTDHREPDLSAITAAAEGLAQRLRPGQVVVLESTTYPGTTREVLAPILERSGMIAGEDFHLAFSPERVDPGRTDWTTASTPKVMGGLTDACTEAALDLYGQAFDRMVPVATPEIAEMTKLLENIFRGVNIALVNELAVLCDRMDIDVWSVIDAAATKPFGFMPFRPGPGLGGHCIPIDPFYLTWKAREFGMHTEFIELAGKINSKMPEHCVDVLARALNEKGLAVKGSRLLVLGVAYKPNVNDMRESPALEIIDLLHERGAELRYHDPHVAQVPSAGLDSVELSDEELSAADAVMVVTDHDAIDWDRVATLPDVVVDFRSRLQPEMVRGRLWRL